MIAGVAAVPCNSCTTMSVSQTIKTRVGIKNFTLPSVDGDEFFLAFNYVDKKTEVHLLKRECAPLYLEENTTIGLLNSEQLGVFLLAVTPSPKHGKGCCLTFRVWDSASILGFTPKEIQVQDGEGSFVQDGKFRGQMNLNETVTDLSAVKVDCLGTMVAVATETDIILWEVQRTDVGVLQLQYLSSFNPKGKQTSKEFLLLQLNGAYSIAFADSGSIAVWNICKTGASVCPSISIPNRPNGAATLPEKLQRFSPSKIVFTDDLGNLWICSLHSNSVTSIKLPGCCGGCGVFSFTSSNVKDTGKLAVCSEGHSINLYTFEDNSTSSPAKAVNVCGRPFKIIFSTAPVNSLAFVKPDTLAVASSSNRTLSFWTGLFSGAN